MKRITIAQKFNKLKTIFKKMDSVLVAYSGGVDSTLLIRVAKDTLKDNVLAITAKSPTYPSNEERNAKDMASRLGVKHKIITTHELSNPEFKCNPVNRCYYCKRELFSALAEIAKKNRLRFVVDGSNYDDRKDFRPGNKAKDELNVRSPLKEAGLTKRDIRTLSKKSGLPTWDKPSLACLASRFPYGKHLTRKELDRVSKAEEFLQGLGFRQVRVRHYGDTVRIEVEGKKISSCIVRRASIVKKMKKLGYTYVTLDLEGYRTGSMNEMIKKEISKEVDIAMYLPKGKKA